MHDPLRHLSALRALRERLQAMPTDAPERAALLEELARELVATRPPERVPLPWRQRLGLAGAVVALGLCGYAFTGNWQGWQARPAVDAGALMVQRLAERLAANPEAARADDWAMLGRSQAVLGRSADAIAAYRRALALEPQADVLAALADVLATEQGGSLAGEPAALVAQALTLQPDHVQAHALAAAAAWAAGQRREARQHWQRVKDLAPEGDPLRASAEQGLALPDSPLP